MDNFLRRITEAPAQELAEWWSIAHDLDHVIAASQRLHSLPDQQKDATLVRSLWSSALIAYRRCFKTGRRIHLKPTCFSGLAGEPEKMHAYYMRSCQKHIAHPVNIFEENLVGVVLKDEGTILGPGHLHIFQISEDKPGVWNLGWLATEARKRVHQQIQRLETALLELAKSKSAKELAELPIAEGRPNHLVQAARKAGDSRTG